MNQPKLCKDCKWVKRDPIFGIFGNYRFAQCLAPQAAEPSDGLVDGGNRKTIGCETHRNVKAFANYCGVEGRFWEPKP